MRINTSYIFLLFFVVLFFCFSYSLLSHYTEYDQRSYQLLYNFLSNKSFTDLLNLSFEDLRSFVNTSEPISIFIYWIGGTLGSEKRFYMSILNLIFLFGILYFLKKNKAPWFMYVFVITNFYFLVLLTAAERLKFAYIIFIYGHLINNNFVKNLLFIATPLAHIQFSLVLLGQLILKFITLLQLRILKINNLFIFIIGFLFLFFVLFIIISPGITKFSNYKEFPEITIGLFNTFFQKSLLLEFFFLYLIKDNFKFLILTLPMFVVSFIIGDWRINILIFTIGFYFIVKEQKCDNILFVFLMTYFSIKSLSFVYKIYKYGHGF